jgi:uncharacterized SAM-binding protein YcdF (DUF218 family)
MHEWVVSRGDDAAWSFSRRATRAARRKPSFFLKSKIHSLRARRLARGAGASPFAEKAPVRRATGARLVAKSVR